MSFLGYFWHAVVLSGEHRFKRAEWREKYLYPSVETDKKPFILENHTHKKEQVKVIKPIMASTFYRNFGG